MPIDRPSYGDKPPERDEGVEHTRPSWRLDAPLAHQERPPPPENILAARAYGERVEAARRAALGDDSPSDDQRDQDEEVSWPRFGDHRDAGITDEKIRAAYEHIVRRDGAPEDYVALEIELGVLEPRRGSGESRLRDGGAVDCVEPRGSDEHELHEAARPDQSDTDPEKEQTRPDNTGEKEPEPSGWDASRVAEDSRRPETEHIHLADDRREHILDGSPDGRGGHRHGTGVPGKTEFPPDWDDETVATHIMDVACRPDSARMQGNGRWQTLGERDGVQLAVVVEPNGRIVTAWPLPGGRGVVDNPADMPEEE